MMSRSHNGIRNLLFSFVPTFRPRKDSRLSDATHCPELDGAESAMSMRVHSKRRIITLRSKLAEA